MNIDDHSQYGDNAEETRILGNILIIEIMQIRQEY